MSTEVAPVVSGAATVSPVVWLSTSVPPNVVPMFSVVVPPVPIQIFFSSIDPSSRVLVKVQVTSVSYTHLTLPTTRTVTGSPPCSLQANIVT